MSAAGAFRRVDYASLRSRRAGLDQRFRHHAGQRLAEGVSEPLDPAAHLAGPGIAELLLIALYIHAHPISDRGIRFRWVPIVP